MPRGRRATGFLAPIFTRCLCRAGNSLCIAYAPPLNVAALHSGVQAMDIVYLILLSVLVALTGGFLWLCARLEQRR